MAKFQVLGLRNPWTDCHKFGMGDYVGDMTPYAKIQMIASMGVSRQMGEILLSLGF